ncbi:hypothetical protein FHX44_115869 [Pseudonocardia hierapolitana]|uniref:Phosphodiesterase n=1 Tax=Pseudonocardia hierapolitana TaxID=1128676 RepID=A0A561SYM8_9PSEU|nr:phosphodiesterase [Pseudonocardia hierapolitana]TWF79933.1 hypothetical protein FHX44_115869 [Pseudonocardia hierapolitana]
MPGLPQLVAAAFARLARWRRAPAFHPRGTLFDGRVALTERESATATALGGTGERPALVRLSKGVGTPGALPDLLGVALRTEVGGHVLDVLFTSGRRRLLVPSTGWGRRPYTTLLPYTAAGARVVLGLDPEAPAAAADPAAATPMAFTVTERERGGAPRPVGRLVLVAPHTGDPVAFDPVLNAHPQLRPAAPLRRLRVWAYTGSRRGRGAARDDLHRRPPSEP